MRKTTVVSLLVLSLMFVSGASAQTSTPSNVLLQCITPAESPVGILPFCEVIVYPLAVSADGYRITLTYVKQGAIVTVTTDNPTFGVLPLIVQYPISSATYTPTGTPILPDPGTTPTVTAVPYRLFNPDCSLADIGYHRNCTFPNGTVPTP